MASTSSILQQLEKFQNHPDSPVIDVRNSEEYAVGHYAGAAQFCAEQILYNLHRLPQKTQPIRLSGCKRTLDTARKKLEVKGFKIVACLQWCPQTASELNRQGLLEKGFDSRVLWLAAPVVRRFIEQFSSTEVVGNALDLACGAGRDSVYLALNGWQVLAVDYLPGALEKVERLAQQHQVNVTTCQTDLETLPESLLVNQLSAQNCPNQPASAQRTTVFNLVLVVRYLHRPLFPLIKQKVNPGGFLVYQTFLKGCEAFGSPKNPNYLLEPGELAREFADFDILVDEIEYLADGRPTNVFIAQKPKRHA